MRDKYNNAKRRHSLESTASQLSVYKRNEWVVEKKSYCIPILATYYLKFDNQLL